MKEEALSVRREVVICFVLVAAVLAIYLQTLGHDFINYDDPLYVTENPHVQRGVTWRGIAWALTSGDASNWHPLTWVSHMIDCGLYGPVPGGHHLTSVLLHAVNAVLLFVVFRRMTGALWQSAFVAAAFAVHPLRVESVAWVAERKDVLSGLFWVLAIGIYHRYARRTDVAWYICTTLAMALGLMAKPMLVTLPCVFLLLDYWPLGRVTFGPTGRWDTQVVRKRLLEKGPFFILSGISSVITLWVQAAGGAVTSLRWFPLDVRLQNAVVAYVRYPWKMLWPARLALPYPHPGEQLSVWAAAGAFVLLAGVTVLVFWNARKRPYLMVGWLWYLVTLAPVIGIVQVGAQAMADRYTYIPLIGLSIMAAWGISDVLAAWRHRAVALSACASVVLLAWAVCAWVQTGYWRNDVILFSHALDVTSGNYIAHFKLGSALFERGEMDASADQFGEALVLLPNFTEARSNLGVVRMHQGRYDEAAHHLREALRLDPNYTNAREALAWMQEHAGLR